MKLSGLHLLLTYACTYECDHCFVWGSPSQRGTLTLSGSREILRQAQELGGVEWIYFEGGEPFLYYAALWRAVEMASDAGFQVGVVSNSYWATDEEDAVEQLRPFAGRVQDLSLSCDLYHGEAEHVAQVERARRAAESLSIPCDVITIAQPGDEASGDECGVRLRGRAAATLAERTAWRPFREFDSCPYENLRDPGRVHVDPLGHVHVCQGISIGNLFETPLAEICRDYDPDAHPVVGPLLRGGPARLAQEHGVSHGESYGDACHFCDAVRRELRARFPRELAPDQMYGVVDS
jgi:MoaA/NifB/PqqE/SkfB family radical SAM enzyme